MDKLNLLEARDRKISVAETNRHLKLIKLLKEEKIRLKQNENNKTEDNLQIL